jgi:hypothetical protein
MAEKVIDMKPLEYMLDSIHNSAQIRIGDTVTIDSYRSGIKGTYTVLHNDDSRIDACQKCELCGDDIASTIACRMFNCMDHDMYLEKLETETENG